jgi:peroxiredoxin
MKVLRSAAWLVLVFAVGVAGVYVGGRTRGRVDSARSPHQSLELANHQLPLGDPFPDVPLIGADGHTRSSRELAAGGSVVLFLDLDCPPCTDLAHRWQAAIDHRLVEPDRVFAVCYYPRHLIADYRAAQGLTLPVYQDSLQTFRTIHGVDRFPLAVTVGASGLVRGTSYDSVSPIDLVEVTNRLER